MKRVSTPSYSQRSCSRQTSGGWIICYPSHKINMFAGDFFGNIFQQATFQHGGQANPPQDPNFQPPASNRAINNLPSVIVTSDDLLEETNKECVFCLVEQELGSTACKLPCGHLYHRGCVVQWLQRKCTCPVCRYELETDDPQYETQRKKRMKTRKLRMRRDEIQSKSVAQLRQLCGQLNLTIAHCIDKKEIVDMMVASGLIDITERVPPIEISYEDFNNKSVSQLKHLLLSFGLSDAGALEKHELRKVLLESERIHIFDGETVVVDDDSMRTNTNSIVSYAADSASSYVDPSPSYSSSYTTTQPSPSSPLASPGVILTVSSSTATTPTSSSRVTHRFTTAELQDMSLSRIRSLCTELGVSTAGCLDKLDVIDRLKLCSKVEIIQES
ncbi:hypothetical protein EON65_51395 [archaeon]|nr:MAG: hypothetical protein EON65_51395 [archaeon]